MLSLMRAVTLDEVAAYNQAGVVLLRGVLSLRFVNTLRASIDRVVQTLSQSPSGYDFTEILRATERNDVERLRELSGGQYDLEAIMSYVKSTGKPMLADAGSENRNGSYYIDTGIAAKLKSYRQLCVNGALTEIAGQLLGANAVRFFGDQVFVKEPNTPGKTAFHQDATYFEIEGEQCCVMWVPVDPVGLEHGLIHFDVEPGDVLVHHYRTIHGTGGNRSRYQVRRAASIRYCGDDIRFKERPWAPRQLHHTQRLKTGDLLSGSPDFPVVWTRKPAERAA